MKQQKETICYLVRHGHPQLPDGRKYYLGRTDLSLSPQGIAQAQWLEQFFAQQPVTAIYHSPLCRCRQTAEIIGGQRIPCRPVTDLQEIAMGQWEMLPMAQVKQQYPQAYWQRGKQIAQFCPPGGESFVQCQQRSIAALQQIAAWQPAGNACVIVAHAGVNRCLLSWIGQQPLEQLLTIAQPYGCITPLIWDGMWRAEQSILCPVQV